MQNRLKSKIVWLGVLAQVLLIVTLFMPQMADYVKVIGAAVIEIATLIGILNNPTDPTKF